MKISIFGTGYVGLVTGTCLANLGHEVNCVDIDLDKINKLNKGVIPIYEPGLSGLIVKNKSKLTFTTDPSNAVKNSKIIFIAVGTPQREDGSADLQYVKSVAEEIAQHINSYKVIVIKSTVPVGTSDLVENIIRTKFNGEFDVVSNPEFLKEGSAIDDFANTDRIVIGSKNKKAAQLVQKMYEKLKCPFVVTDRRSSELIKYASNAFLATKISFINSIANLSEKVGADITDIARGIGFDKRINPHFLNAGIGYGGSCFPKDVKALIFTAKDYNSNLELLSVVDKLNENQKQIVVKKLEQKLSLQSAKIAILGLAFKPNTDDIREAPSLTIIKELLKKGAKLSAWDPVA